MPDSNSHFYLPYPKSLRRWVMWQRGRPQVSALRPSTVSLSSCVQTSLASFPTFGVPPSPPPLRMRRWISHAGKHVSPMGLEETDHLQAALPRALLFHPSPQTAGVVARCRNGALFIYFCFPRFYARIRARCCWTVLLVLMLLALLLVLEWIFYLTQYKECWRIDSGVLLSSIDGCWCGLSMLWLVS